MSPCQSCGGSELIEDHCGQLVCTNCGTVVSTEALTTDANFDIQRNFVAINESGACTNISTKKSQISDSTRTYGPTKLVSSCITIINDMCKRLALPAYMRERAEALFLEKEHSRNYKHYYPDFKHKLAVCSVLVTCRNEGQPVNIIRICQVAKLDRSNFTTFCCKYLHVLFDVDYCPYESYIPSLLGGLNWSRQLTDKTKTVLGVLTEMLLEHGEMPATSGIVHISAWIAWNSESTENLSYRAFCAKNNLKHGIAMNFCRKVSKLLYEEAVKVPWLTARDVKKKTVMKCIDDIIRHQKMVKVMESDEEDSNVTTIGADNDGLS